MSGSLKWFEYDTDQGDNFAIFMDESNGEAVGNEDYGPASVAIYKVPGNVQTRYARYSSVDNRYARNIVCSTPDVLLAAPDTLSIADGNGGSVDVILRQRVGETVAILPTALDTGIDDGDET